jgi:hypothetical protein
MALVLIGLVGTYVLGQEESAAELYGRGVHSYFAGNYPQAIDLLSKSIQKNDADPRAHYFRGLAMAGQAGIEAGRADFAKGADIEYNNTERRAYDINKALQRVQGSLRLAIERQRAETRKAAAELKKRRDRVRYEQLKRREDIVLYDPNRPASKVELDLPKPDIPAQDDPFESGMAFTGGKQVDYVAPEPVEPTDQAPMEPEEGQPRDPFAAPGAKKPTQPEDPFATPGKKEVNPFGEMTPAPKKLQAEEDPGDVNPFGDDLPAVPPEEPSDAGPGPPVTNAGGALINLLGKTLTGKSGGRDPFADAPDDAPKEDRQPEEPVEEDPFGESGAKQEAAKKKPPVDDDPFGESGAKQGAPKKKPPVDDDPFK